jgi:exoribonuclease R
VVVHRLLAAAIGIAPLPDSVRDKEALHDCAGNLNTRHRNAQMAGRASVELHTLIFFKDNSVVADARVVKVRCFVTCACAAFLQEQGAWPGSGQSVWSSCVKSLDMF